MADRIGIWRGPFPGETINGGIIQPGDPYPVTDSDLESGHWDVSDDQSPPEPAPAPEPTPVFPDPPAEPEPTPEETE